MRIKRMKKRTGEKYIRGVVCEVILLQGKIGYLTARIIKNEIR